MRNIERNTTQIVKSQKVESNCRSIAFKRLTGSEPCSIDGYPLQDGETMEFNCFPGEIDVHKYALKFTETGLDKMVYVFRELEV